jgi:hypothetical protein
VSVKTLRAWAASSSTKWFHLMGTRSALKLRERRARFAERGPLKLRAVERCLLQLRVLQIGIAEVRSVDYRAFEVPPAQGKITPFDCVATNWRTRTVMRESRARW